MNPNWGKEYKAWKEKPLPDIPKPTINQPSVPKPNDINVPLTTITNHIEELSPYSPEAATNTIVKDGE